MGSFFSPHLPRLGRETVPLPIAVIFLSEVTDVDVSPSFFLRVTP